MKRLILALYLCTLTMSAYTIACPCPPWPMWQGHGEMKTSFYRVPSQVKRNDLYIYIYIYIILYVCMCVLPGTTLAASMANLTAWLDGTIERLTEHNTSMYVLRDSKTAWFYHQILLTEFITITPTLSQAFAQWVHDCAVNSNSCGVCFYVAGSGHGNIEFTYQARWRPFIG